MALPYPMDMLAPNNSYICLVSDVLASALVRHMSTESSGQLSVMSIVKYTEIWYQIYPVVTGRWFLRLG